MTRKECIEQIINLCYPKMKKEEKEFWIKFCLVNSVIKKGK